VLVAGSTSLFGRSDELTALGEAVGRARDGSPVCVVLEGEAGVGKTCLVDATIRDHGRVGDLIAFGHGVELAGGELPFGTAAEVLRHVARETGEEVLKAAAGEYASDLAALYPSLGGQSAAFGSATTPARLFPAMVSTVETLAADRLVWLVIEDLQWVDESTCDFVQYLARVVDGCRLILLITVRTDDLGSYPVAAQMAANLAGAPTATRMLVAPLARDDAAKLVVDLTAGGYRPDEVARVVALGRGNPMLTEQLVAAGLAAIELPASVLAPVASRLRELNPATRHLLDVACLGEGHLAHRLLVEVYARTAHTIGDQGLPTDDDVNEEYEIAVDNAIAEKLLRFDPAERSFAFTHALLRHAVDAEVTPISRMRIHRVWAQVLTERRTGGDDPYLQIAAAHHWFAADADNEAFDAALTAAEYAKRLQASAETALLLRRALTLWDRAAEPNRRYPMGRDELAMDVIAAYDDCDQLAEALQVLDAELIRARSNVDRLRVDCLRAARSAYAEWLGEGADPDIVQDLLGQCAVISAAPPSAMGYWALRTLGGQLWPKDPEASLQACRDAVDVARQLDNPRHLQGALSELQFHLVNAGEFDETLAALEPALEEARGQDPLGVLNLASLRCATLYHAGRFNESRDAMTAGRAQLPDRRLYPAYWAFSCRNLSLSLEALGEWDTVEELQQEACQAGASESDAVYMQLEWEGLFACARGDVDRAGLRLRDLRSLPIHDTWYLWALRTAHLEAQVAIARGNYSAARDLLTPVLTPEQPAYLGEYWPAALTAATLQADWRAAHGGSDPADDQATRAVTELVDQLPRTGPYRAARYAHATAALAHARGTDNPEAWDEVAGLWRSVEHVPFLAWALLRLAHAHAQAGARAAAATPLSEAWEISRHLGATPLSERLIALAQRLRLPIDARSSVEPTAHGPLTRLTHRELEVLKHVALGETNEEIGTALFISPKTVSVHVSNILAKLDVTSRARATAIAYEHGLLAQADDLG
jgi:DNA-binding CsgD family transcriptional regulator